MPNYYDKSDSTEFFPTPKWIVDICYSMIPNAKTILDPCAGDCALEDFSKDIKYTLLDINPRCDNIEQADFLKWTTDKKFDAAICNPPFGLKDEFIQHLFEFTNEIVLIAPIKSIINVWANHIDDIRLNWKIPFEGFGILTSVGIFHLTKSTNNNTVKSLRNKYFLPTDIGIDTIITTTDHHISNNPGLYVPTTKAQIVRNEEILKDMYVFNANDESVFIAKKASKNNAKGDILNRNIIYTKTVDDAYKIIEMYRNHANYVREYAYQYGNNILNLKYIPLLPGIKDLTVNLDSCNNDMYTLF